jgi:hypothetical protein
MEIYNLIKPKVNPFKLQVEKNPPLQLIACFKIEVACDPYIAINILCL